MKNEIISREDAKSMGLVHYFTGKSCKHGHISRRIVSDTHCCDCLKEKGARYRKENAAEVRCILQKWYERNAAKVSEQGARYRAENVEKIKASHKKYRSKNLHVARVTRLNRRAAELNATPNWDRELTEFVALEAGKLAQSRERATGIPWHIDHMIPLQARVVCGLHVWNNLQVIPAVLNLSKANRLMLTQPGEWVRHV